MVTARSWSYSVSLPHVGGGSQSEVPVDDQGVVDVYKKCQLLLPTESKQLHPLQLNGQLSVALKGGVHRHALVVHRLRGQGHMGLRMGGVVTEQTLNVYEVAWRLPCHQQRDVESTVSESIPVRAARAQQLGER